MAGKRKASTKEEKEKQMHREVPEAKLKLVEELISKFKKYKTLLVASTKGLPSSQFHQIKKNLRGKAEIAVVKRSVLIRAIENSGKGDLLPLKEQINADVALFFSDLDAFELSGLLADNQSPTRAKAGEIALEDIEIEPGPTDLVAGPAISELSSVGLRVAVESGKIAIKNGAKVAWKGEPIKENVANVLGKLNILPMKVGFEPIAAYDAKANKVYIGIKIDKAGTLEELRNCIGKALGFTINIKYLVKENLTYFLAKANAEEKAVQKLIDKAGTQTTPAPTEQSAVQPATGEQK